MAASSAHLPGSLALWCFVALCMLCISLWRINTILNDTKTHIGGLLPF